MPKNNKKQCPYPQSPHYVVGQRFASKQKYTNRLEMLVIEKGRRKKQRVRERYFMIETASEVLYE